MKQRWSILVPVLVVALAALTAACQSKASSISPTAPTVVGQVALDASATAGSVGSATTAVAAEDPFEARGLIRRLNAEKLRFTLMTKNGPQLVQASPKTAVMHAKPRERLRFSDLKDGMPVAIQGKVQRGVLLARLILVLPPAARPGSE